MTVTKILITRLVFLADEMSYVADWMLDNERDYFRDAPPEGEEIKKHGQELLAASETVKRWVKELAK